jgi:pseudouridine-5'-phosphate glycosidase
VVTLAPAVEAALRAGRPVVALESSVFAQGLPAPHNAEAAARMNAAIMEAGALPAITGVVRGRAVAGLAPDELARFLRGDAVVKASARDLGSAIAGKRDAATTVAASLVLCHATGISVFATGGIGGVHRQPAFDESADLIELARTPIMVVCSGAKSVLDLPATVERLETLGIPVIGYRTSEFPGFHYASTGIPVPSREDDLDGIVASYRAQRALGHPAAVVVVQPPPAEAALDRTDVEAAIDRAIAAAKKAGIRGSALTPWLLSELSRATEGRTLQVNLALLEANARLAAELAVRLSRRDDS